MAAPGSINHISPGRGLKKGILFLLLLGLLLKSWLVFTIFFQATAKQFNVSGTTDSWDEVW